MPDSKTGGDVSVEIVDKDVLHNKIHVVRGQKVMLDFELAEIYGYSTKNFNRQVKNNLAKFEGEDFMFQLTANEWDILRCNFCTSSWGGTRYLPFAFTEQGVYMLMTVLKGDLAVRQSRALIRLFKRLKDHALEGRDLVGKGEHLELAARVDGLSKSVESIRKDLQETDRKVDGIIGGLSDAIRNSAISDVAEGFGVGESRLIMGGEPVEGKLAYAEIYVQASSSVFVVDDYIGLETLALLKSVAPGVVVTVFSDNRGRGLHVSDFEAFHREYPSVDVSFVCTCGKVHDRLVVLDYGTLAERLFLCGGSSKDAGKRASAIVEVSSPSMFRELVDELLANPPLELG